MYSVKSWHTYQYRLFSCSSCEALVRPLISGKEYNYSNENMAKASLKSSSLTLPLLHDRLIAVTLIWVPALGTGFQHPVRPIPKFPSPLQLCLNVSGSRMSLHKRLRTANVLHCSSAVH